MYFSVTPHTRCRLKLLKSLRIKDYLLMEEEFIKNQERLKPQEEKQEVGVTFYRIFNSPKYDVNPQPNTQGIGSLVGRTSGN